jgi:hypothetical protein
VPTLLHALGVGIVEINGDRIVRRSVGIPEWEEKYPPEWVSDYAREE